MKITVFTSCFNQAEFLSQAIDSVLGQTHPDVEYLLYDDGSTDGTWEIMESYQSPSVKVCKLDKQPNVGAIINRSFREMTGGAWVWCPADDRLYSWCVEEKYKLSKAHPNAVIYSNWNKIDEKGLILTPVALKHKTPDQFAKDIWHKCDIGFTGIYIPRSVIDKVPPFPEDMDCSEDYFWTLKAVQVGIPFVHMPLATHEKRIHANRTTTRHKPDRAAVAERARSS